MDYFERFDSRPPECENLEFYGVQIETIPNDGLAIQQSDYIEKIK